MYTYIPIANLFQILFFYELLQNVEYSSCHCILGPCCSSVLNIVCVSINPKVLTYPFSMPFSFGNYKFVFYVCGSVPVWGINNYSFVSFLILIFIDFLKKFCLQESKCTFICLLFSKFESLKGEASHGFCVQWPEQEGCRRI